MAIGPRTIEIAIAAEPIQPQAAIRNSVRSSRCSEVDIASADTTQASSPRP